MLRRGLPTALGLAALAGAALAQVPAGELYSELPAVQLIDAARQVAASDPVAALITVDGEGRPRARSVEVHWREVSWPSAAEQDLSGFELWIATRPGTRKLQQIEAEPDVALYFEKDDAGSYLSVMGQAEIVRDAASVRRESWHSAEQRDEFYPGFPQDMILIRLRVTWFEVITPNVEASEDLWRPQAFVVPESSGR